MPPVADVPLPVPRPHFSGDATPPETKAAPPVETRPASAPTAATSPTGTNDAARDATLPLPPARPAELTPKPARVPQLPPATVAAPKPAMSTPGNAASGAKLGEAPGQPVDDTACPARLKARNVAVEPVSIGPQPDVRCSVVEAVNLTGLTMPDGSKVEFPDHPTIACTTADAFSLYVRDLLSPLAKGTYGAAVASVWTGPGLECRSRDHILGAKLSAHGQGLAIDIAQLKLSNGFMIQVGLPKTEADQGFETASRAAACGYFHTVLGPGSDSYHRTHWHFDLEVRGSKSDGKYCK